MRVIPTFYFYKSYWYHFNDLDLKCYICGWAEYKGEILFAKELFNILKYLDLKNDILFRNFVSDLNGNFSIIVSSPDKTLLAADRMRMFPIIYFFKNDQIVITDKIDRYQKECPTHFSFNSTTLEQYFFSDYVFGPFTIFEDVFSIQAGEIVTINHFEKTINRQQYFKWVSNMLNDSFKRNLADEAHQQEIIFLNVFTRMLKSAPNVNNWIIPLSGGYDSRVIVNYLFKLGIQNVICFSYGMENNIQSDLSRKIAQKLGYEWYFIDYKYWVIQVCGTNLIDQFSMDVFNGTSVAHLQDFIAVYALKQMGVLENQDIFVPGHALEVLAGNHLDHKMKNCKNLHSSLSIIKKHFSNFGYSDKNRIDVYNHVEGIIENYTVMPEQMAEFFDWQERQTKFIAYSVKVYEFFGFDWRIPEWDLELFEYWKLVGFNHRINRNMFKDIFKEYLCVDILKDIPYANDLLENRKRTIKSIVFNNFPLKLKRIFKVFFYSKSLYYSNEGLHLIYSNRQESIEDYLNSFDSPTLIKKHLSKYPKRQKLSILPINSVTTLFNIRNCKNFEYFT